MTNIRKNKIYGNWTVLSVRGEEIFKCLEERANWYLSRNLASKVSENPPKIQLNFEVKKEGNKGDLYYLSPKSNVCVKCGTDNLEVLTKHHVVPQMYRKFLPLIVKSRNSFDVLPMCNEHHEEYERIADNLKQKLASKYNAPLVGIVISDVSEEVKALQKARSAARAIINYSENIPEDRKSELYSALKKYLNKQEISEVDIITLSNVDLSSEVKVKTHGEIVMEQITDYQEFVEMWRFHFLQYVNPKFMPPHWDPKRSIFRE